jgi:putative transposase
LRDIQQLILNTHVLHSIEEAREKLDEWRVDYNTKRPHGSLGDLIPCEYA